MHATSQPTHMGCSKKMGMQCWGYRTFSSARTKWPPFATVIRYLREYSKATVPTAAQCACSACRIVESGPFLLSKSVQSRAGQEWLRVYMQHLPSNKQVCNATSNCSMQHAPCDIAYKHACTHAYIHTYTHTASAPTFCDRSGRNVRSEGCGGLSR